LKKKIKQMSEAAHRDGCPFTAPVPPPAMARGESPEPQFPVGEEQIVDEEVAVVVAMEGAQSPTPPLDTPQQDPPQQDTPNKCLTTTKLIFFIVGAILAGIIGFSTFVGSVTARIAGVPCHAIEWCCYSSYDESYDSSVSKEAKEAHQEERNATQCMRDCFVLVCGVSAWCIYLVAYVLLVITMLLSYIFLHRLEFSESLWNHLVDYYDFFMISWASTVTLCFKKRSAPVIWSSK
jgi:hypothetical protein